MRQHIEIFFCVRVMIVIVLDWIVHNNNHDDQNFDSIVERIYRRNRLSKSARIERKQKKIKISFEINIEHVDVEWLKECAKDNLYIEHNCDWNINYVVSIKSQNCKNIVCNVNKERKTRLRDIYKVVKISLTMCELSLKV